MAVFLVALRRSSFIVRWPTWSGAWRVAELGRRPHPSRISRVAPWSTSPAASRPLICVFIWASASATPTPKCNPTPWCSAPHRRLSLVVGWFGFTRGSALAASSLATQRLWSTPIICRRRRPATSGWSISELDSTTARPTALGRISGAVAGLVAITPASGLCAALPGAGHRTPRRHLLLLHGLHREELLRLRRLWTPSAFMGAGGTLGALLTGLSLPPAPLTPPSAKTPPATLSPPAHWDGQHGARCSTRLPAWLAWGISDCRHAGLAVPSSIKLIGLRVSHRAGSRRLDITQHGEEGYDLNT